MAGQRPKGWKLLKAALATRKSATMLAFGFSSGLPFALLIGTLNAWLGDAKINLATIGVLSWIGLAYAFKFLWSPLVDRVQLPLLGGLGRRTSWIVLCQIGLIVSFVGLGASDPAASIGWFAIFAVIGAFSSATQDIAVDAWRIDVADERTNVELLSAVYQFGYRTASIVGGAFALFLAARIPWGTVYFVMAALVVGVMIVASTAPDTQRPPTNVIEQGLEQAGEISASVRLAALLVRRRLLGVGDHHARPVHGLDASSSADRDQAAFGCGLHRKDRPLDHRCDGVRAAGHCRWSELAEGTWQSRPAGEPSPSRPAER